MILEKLLPESYSAKEEAALRSKIKELTGHSSSRSTVEDLSRLLSLVTAYESKEDTSGFHRMFKPGTEFGIENLPKHKALFDATRDYREVLMLGGNRCGKTTAGAVTVAMTATGEYEDWWGGVRYATPTSCWAVGKTGQTTRDTVQEALMGPVGAWGTGALPKDSILDWNSRAGIPNALDQVLVKHVSGGVSSIGFKSYDQKQQSFFGVAKNVIWLDEPCPDLVYHECLVRTTKLRENPITGGPKGGRIIHTITPKEGLTMLLAEFLSSCELLAGAERIKGLEALITLAKENEEKKLGIKE